MSPSGSSRNELMAAAAASADPREGQSASIPAASRSNSGGIGAHPGWWATLASPLLVVWPSGGDPPGAAVRPSGITATRGARQMAVVRYMDREALDSAGRGGTAPAPALGPPPR